VERRTKKIYSPEAIELLATRLAGNVRQLFDLVRRM